MLFPEQRRIIGLYKTNPYAELTIKQIMHSLGKKSYNWTYLAIQKLSKKGILHIKKNKKNKITLNLESYETLTNLVYTEKTKAPKKLLNRIRKTTPFFILLKNKKQTTAIVDNQYTKKRLKQQKIPKLKIITKKEIVEPASRKNQLILHGAEIYQGV